VNDIKMDLGDIGWGNINRIGLTQDRDKCESGNEPSDSIKCWEVL
jgi:hypothetical protein